MIVKVVYPLVFRTSARHVSKRPLFPGKRPLFRGLLAVHNLNGNKWNLLPWNLAAFCQRCHHRVQWTIDFCQSN